MQAVYRLDSLLWQSSQNHRKPSPNKSFFQSVLLGRERARVLRNGDVFVRWMPNRNRARLRGVPPGEGHVCPVYPPVGTPVLDAVFNR